MSQNFSINVNGKDFNLTEGMSLKDTSLTREARVLLSIFDKNHDGKLGKQELQKVTMNDGIFKVELEETKWNNSGKIEENGAYFKMTEYSKNNKPLREVFGYEDDPGRSKTAREYNNDGTLARVISDDGFGVEVESYGNEYGGRTFSQKSDIDCNGDGKPDGIVHHKFNREGKHVKDVYEENGKIDVNINNYF